MNPAYPDVIPQSNFLLRTVGLLFAAWLLWIPPAEAIETTLYMGGHVGATYQDESRFSDISLGTQQVSFDPSFNFNGVFGVELGRHFRIESELGYHENAIDKTASDESEMSLSAFLVNGYYDFDLTPKIRPYLSGGIGFGFVKMDAVLLGVPVDDDNSVIVYQLGTGLGWEFLPRVIVSFGYRYIASVDDPEFTAGTNIIQGEYANHELNLGIRYRFE